MALYVVHEGTGTVLDFRDGLFVVSYDGSDEEELLEKANQEGWRLAELIPSAAISRVMIGNIDPQLLEDNSDNV